MIGFKIPLELWIGLENKKNIEIFFFFWWNSGPPISKLLLDTYVYIDLTEPVSILSSILYWPNSKIQ